MSAHFDGASLASWTGQIYNSYPNAMFAWMKPADNTGFYGIMAAGENANGQYNAFWSRGPNGVVNGRMQATGSNSDAGSAFTISTAWQPFLFVCTNSSSFTVRYATFASESAGGPVQSLGAFDRVVFGNSISNTTPLLGDVAEGFFWQGTVPNFTTDWTSLAAGALPETIAAAGLIDYWTFVGGSLTSNGGKTLTVTGGTVTAGATHPITRGAGGTTLANLERATSRGSFRGQYAVDKESGMLLPEHAMPSRRRRIWTTF